MTWTDDPRPGDHIKPEKDITYTAWPVAIVLLGLFAFLGFVIWVMFG